MPAKDAIELAREVIEFAVPVLLLLGIAVSIYGTFLLTRWYHTAKAPNFLKTFWYVVWNTCTFRPQNARNLADTQAMIGDLSKENRAVSLIGLYWVFLGFVLQGLGTVLQLADFLYGLKHPPKPPCC